MPEPIKLTFSEWQSMIFDLRVAADCYQRDADDCDKIPHGRLGDQFRSQVTKTRTLADRFDVFEVQESITLFADR